MEIEVEKLPQYDILYNLPPETRTVILIGGRGGAKTYEASKFIAYSATIHQKRCVVIRDEKERIRESILNEIWQRYDTANENGILDRYYVKNDTELKSRKTGESLIYTQGFRASNNDKKANLKGASNIDIAIIEEAEDIRDQDKYNTFVDSLRKTGSIILILLNTPDINHWIIKRFFHTEQIEAHDGYFDIIPKDIPGFVCIKTGFEDNPFLPNNIISDYNGYGTPGHHLYNIHYYLTSIKGYASTGRKGQIFGKAKRITLEAYRDLPFNEYFAQDFGTARPAAMASAKIDRNNIYLRELNYEPMDVLDIGRMYCKLRLTPNDLVIADCAEPDSIRKLKNGWKDLPAEEYAKYPGLAAGFNIVACDKGPGSIEAGISGLLGMNIFIVEESENFWDEQRKYVWAFDKNGNPTDKPEDQFNHLWDCARYIYMRVVGKKKMFGV